MIPKSDQLYSHYLPTHFEEKKQCLPSDLKGNAIAVVASETTNFQYRSVFNILFQVFKQDPPKHTGITVLQLVKTAYLGKVNQATISQALIFCIVEFSIPLDRILAFVTQCKLHGKGLERYVLQPVVKLCTYMFLCTYSLCGRKNLMRYR